jgi:hypothetical protein
MLCRSFKPASTGGVSRQRGLPPLQRPWRTAARARSGRSSSNKPGFPDGSWPHARGPEIPLQARCGDDVGGDPAAPTTGGLDLQWRNSLQALRHPLAGLGGWFWRWLISTPPLLWVILVLLLSSLPAGRGGEEQGEGSSGMGVFPFFERFSLAQALRWCVVFAEYPLAARGSGERSWGKISTALVALGRRCRSAWLRLSLPLWPTVAARGEEEGAPSGAALEVALSRALLGHVSSWQSGCSSTEPSIYACLLPPVAGAGVSMACLFSPSAAVEWRLLHLLSGIAGVGSPLFRAQP